VQPQGRRTQKEGRKASNLLTAPQENPYKSIREDLAKRIRKRPAPRKGKRFRPQIKKERNDTEGERGSKNLAVKKIRYAHGCKKGGRG